MKAPIEEKLEAERRKVQRLLAKLSTCKKALQYYADEEKYFSKDFLLSAVEQDKGRHAREVLDRL